MLFAGTGLTRGRASGVVTATGARTDLGETARELETTRRGKPPLVIRVEKLSRVLALATVVGCALVFTLGVARGFGVGEMFLISVALAVAAIPEGLPVAITLALAVGLRRMARRGVLVRRMEAVEGLGSCTVICTDKTGTLTLNELTVSRITTAGGSYAVSGAGYTLEGEVEGEDHAIEALLTSACFANEASLAINKEVVVSGDPTDIAILIAAHKRGIRREPLLEHADEAASLEFESERQFAASFVRDNHGMRVHVKGAPERVLAMCKDAMGVDGSTVALDADTVHAACDELSSRGLRVLAVAQGAAPDDVADDVPERPQDLTFLGLVAMRDSPRPEAAEAVKACREGGVRVILATGDHARTALAVAIELGIAAHGDRAVTGREIEKLDDAAFARLAREANVFARVTPHDKLRLVHALQKQGELVAMTGDGANDAAALKTAHVGVAMGKRGTDVARDAARVVITDDNFASIVAGIEQGRIVHENVRNVVALLVMTGLGELLAILACVLIGLPAPLTASQLLWANLVTEGLQVIGLTLEPGEPGILKRPPRPPGQAIFDRVMITRTLLVSGVIGCAITATFWYLTHAGYSHFAAANLMLLLLVLIENVHIGNCRSEARSALVVSPLGNPWLLGAALLAHGVHIGATHWGPTQRLLHLEPVSIEQWALMFAISLSVLVVVEIHKLIERR
jgi:calcium-translocating P-type ATPase